MKMNAPLVFVALSAILLGSCATERQTQTAIGTGAGAATGAVVGAAVGGGRGAAVGAVVGGGVGAAAGYNWDLIKEKLGIATKGSNVQVSEQRDNSVKLSVPGSVSFASGSAVLNANLHPTLDKIAVTLNEYPASMIRVVGYTDSVGDTQSNLQLSRNRAAAVAEYLSLRGVQRNRMVVDGKGEADPIADNGTEAGRAQNRRVEMLVSAANS